MNQYNNANIPELKSKEGEAPKFSTGLWKKKSQKGNVYVGGSLQNYWVNYYRNDKKMSEEDPSGFLYLYPKDKTDPNPPICINMYVRISKKGIKYLAGMRGKRFHIFENYKKRSPKGPDYNLLITTIEERPRVREVAPQPTMPDNLIENPSYQEPEEDPFGAFEQEEDLPW
jgi:hypothetical protein